MWSLWCTGTRLQAFEEVGDTCLQIFALRWFQVTESNGVGHKLIPKQKLVQAVDDVIEEEDGDDSDGDDVGQSNLEASTGF